VFAFAFGPIQTTGVFNWYPTALAVLAAAASVIGLTLPKHLGGYWLAIAGFAGLALVLFAAAYRLHALAFPSFPRHRLDMGRPWVLDSHGLDTLYDNFLIFDVTFYNREPRQRVNLTVDVLWTRAVGKQRLGPYALSAYRGPAGTLKLLLPNTDIGPQQHVEGSVLFGVDVPGVELGEEGSDFTAPEYYVFDVRLTDNISGAEHTQPLQVSRPD
jgi:hypothetical protein